MKLKDIRVDAFDDLAHLFLIWVDHDRDGPDRAFIRAAAGGLADDPRDSFVKRGEVADWVLTDDIVGGLSYVAVDGDVAMIHAVEVRPEARRRGVARAGLSAAARFAAENGAQWLALAVTEANAPARALYHSAGMENVGRYHYRLAPEQGR